LGADSSHRPCRLAVGDSYISSTVVLPLTTRIVQGDAFPLRVRIRAGVCGLSKDSDILVDQILAWDNELFRRNLGLLPEPLQDEVRRALLEFLDLL
jgi:mRNA interferase MazF